MYTANYMVQDLLGIFIAYALFITILIMPGYVAGYVFDVFEFRKRQSFIQFGIALLLSASISPILFFLARRLFPEFVTSALLIALILLFIVVIIRTQGLQRLAKEITSNPYAKMGLVIAVLWSVLSALFLVDIQLGNRLYYNIVAYDYSTRVSVIDAITRTGVPPANPSYFPGAPQPLTQVYYFWYILCSLIDQLGGRFVDARASLIASVIWTGLILASVVALFTRMRKPDEDSRKVWRNAFTGIGLLFVSGLDIFPSSFYMLLPKLLVGRIFEGDIEQWNEQITAWIGAVTWTPHHVISMLACVLAWTLTASNRTENWSRQMGASLLSGIALASAFGLSVWNTFIFIAFWGIWFFIRLIQREPIKRLWTMILPGVFMAVAVSPFLFDLFAGSQGSVAGGQFPLALNVRAFYPLEFIAVNSPVWERMLIYLLALPLNYFIELGFFLAAGMIWLQNCRNEQGLNNPLVTTEMALLLTTAFLVTFMRSTVIVNNDFGWRGWMLGQFILLFWGVDVIQRVASKELTSRIMVFESPRASGKVRKLLSVLITIGAITTLYDVFFLRTWPLLIDTGIAGFPRVLSPDNHLGERTFATRQAYEFIDKNTPETAIVQFDPRRTMDRPAGLYRTRGTAISYHALYGVPEEIYKPLITAVGAVFDDQNTDWQSLDNACKKYDINILILRDLDPIWSNLDRLKSTRIPLYENRFTTLFTCGD
jgi:hypothetical protein